MNSDDTASVTCIIQKGDLPMNISWTFNGKPVQRLNGISTYQTSKKTSQLTIDSVNAEHAGEFTCIAQNEAGTQSFSSTLNVNG